MEQPRSANKPINLPGIHNVLGVFQARDRARLAIDVLLRSGIPLSEISVVEPEPQASWDALHHIKKPYSKVSLTRQLLLGAFSGALGGGILGLLTDAIFRLDRADIALAVGGLMGLVLGMVVGAMTYVTEVDLRERRRENLDSQRVGVSVGSDDPGEVARAHIVLDECEADLVIDLTETPGGSPITSDSLRVLVSSSLRRAQRP